LLEGASGSWSVSRWSFERGARERVGERARDDPMGDQRAALWVLGEPATPWLGFWLNPRLESEPWLRLERLDGRGPVLELAGGAHGGFRPIPFERPVGFEMGGRLFVPRDEGFEAVPLHEVRAPLDLEGALIVSAEDVPAEVMSGDPSEGGGGPPAAPGPSGPPRWVGREPWLLSYPPAGASEVVLLADAFPGPEGSNPGGFAALPDSAADPGSGGFAGAVFHATSPDAGRELWFTDGTPAGTRRICDFAPGPASGIPAWAAIVPGPEAVFLSGLDPNVGVTLIEVPLSVVRGQAACDLEVIQPPRRLTDADSGCGCRTTGRGSKDSVLLWVVCAVLVVLVITRHRPKRGRSDRNERPA